MWWLVNFNYNVFVNIISLSGPQQFIGDEFTVILKKTMVSVKYHLPIVWNKYLLTKNIWHYKIICCSTTPTFFLKPSFMSAKDLLNLNIFAVTLFIIFQITQCIAMCWLRNVFNCGETMVLWQQGIKGFA